MEFIPKNPKYFECIQCDYKTSNIKDYNKHLQTGKHTNRIKLNDLEQKNPKNPQIVNCKYCNKCYKARNSLWYHQQKCSSAEVVNNVHKKNAEQFEKEFIDKDALIIELLKQNKELLEIVKNGTTNHSHNHTNSHNKAFNLNFFLNETCKDAMNITDFVESIKLQLSDLERVGELGYVEGISNIIVKNLKELDVTQRPVHCTDKKRETMYIKDENTWEKDEEKKKMHKLVKKVADKNMRLLPEYREKYPDYIKASSIISDKYNQIFLESLGGSGDNNYEKEEKIIQKVSREVFVQKDL
jgi:hypothetical protein